MPCTSGTYSSGGSIAECRTCPSGINSLTLTPFNGEYAVAPTDCACKPGFGESVVPGQFVTLHRKQPQGLFFDAACMNPHACTTTNAQRRCDCCVLWSPTAPLPAVVDSSE